jgi:predicted aspartyl protease
LYVKAEINKVPCKLLVDTSSPVSVLSSQIFRKLGVEEGELQATNLALHTADGNSLNIIGKVQVCINIGPHSLDQDVIIAELADLAYWEWTI